MVNGSRLERRTAIVAGMAGIAFGAVSLFQSCSANKKADEANKLAAEANEIAKKSLEIESYKATAKFSISHNQGLDTPSFSIYNESDIKLKSSPLIEYAVLVPSKIYWLFEGDTTPSNGDWVINAYTYLPVDTFREKQEPSTTGIIKTVEMPLSLKSKNNLTSTYDSKLIQLRSNLAIQINTMPFVIIACKITFEEYGSNESISETLITTPLINAKVPNQLYEDMLNYVRDNFKFHFKDALEVENTYSEINKNIYTSLEGGGVQSIAGLMGGVEGGYNCILKYLGEITNPNSPLITSAENNKVDIPDNYAEVCQADIQSYMDTFS